MTAPAVPLTKYQYRWLKDTSRFKIAKWCRQAGKDFVGTLEVVLDCQERTTDWLMLSVGERQSKEIVSAAKIHSKAIGFAGNAIEGRFVDDDGNEYKTQEIHYLNGSRMIALPANPDTARGYSANVYLNEFGLHKNSREIWGALFPTITRGFKVRINSTPKGKKNKFYDIWEHNPKFSKHEEDIYQAVRDGLELRDDEGRPATPDDLREALDDEDLWQQEYLVQFLDEATAFISYDLINQIEEPDLIHEPDWAVDLEESVRKAYEIYRRTKVDVDFRDFLHPDLYMGELFLGMDIGRKRDLSVIWIDEQVDDILVTRAVITLKRTPYWIQEKILLAILSLRNLRRAGIDESGIGAQVAETAVDLFGESKVEGIPFTNANKETLAEGLKNNLEDQRSRVPEDRTIRESIHSVKRFQTPTGHFRFDAERTDKTGHADHFWAKALAVNAAAGDVGGPIEYQSVGRRRMARTVGAY